jgi:hypothetical protein
VLAIVVAESHQQVAMLVEAATTFEPVTDPSGAADDAPVAVWGTTDNVLRSAKPARRRRSRSGEAAHTGTRSSRHSTSMFLELESRWPPSTIAGVRHLQVYSGGQGVWTIA